MLSGDLEGRGLVQGHLSLRKRTGNDSDDTGNFAVPVEAGSTLCVQAREVW